MSDQNSKLWNYNKHYFDYLISKESYANQQFMNGLLVDWVANCQSGVGWEPFPVSKRIVNWIKWHHTSTEAIDSDVRKSLCVQADWLSRRLEKHLMGNHLLANYKALIFSGLFFRGDIAERWLRTGLRGFVEQLEEQVLDDGGHFELSPMYHCLVLEDVLDVINILNNYPNEEKLVRKFTSISHLRAIASKMFNWLQVVLHSDSRISFF